MPSSSFSNKLTMFITLINIIAILLLQSSSLFISAKATQKHIESLLEFRDALNCKYVMNNWNASVAPCYGVANQWSQIYCNADGDVTGIHIQVGDAQYMPPKMIASNNFPTGCSGYFSDALAEVETITTFFYTSGMLCQYYSVAGHMMSQTLPKGWGKLKNLYELSITCEPNIYGSIPIEWKDMTQMNELTLSFLSLGPFLEADLFLAWKDINTMDLSQNNFQNNISTLAFFAKTSIVSLTLSSNSISGNLRDFPGIYNLQILRLDSNLIEGQLPVHWCDRFNGGMFGLHQLFLDNNHGLVGNIPDCYLEDFNPYLSALSLSNCSFSGPISEKLGAMTQLGLFDISSNSFTSLPTNISALINIDQFDVSHNDISMRLVDIPDLWKIGSGNERGTYGKFDVSFNKFYGPLPRDIYKSGFFNSLNFEYNLFDGELPVLWSRATQNCWQFIKLSHNRLTGTLPGSWSAITNETESNGYSCGRLAQLDLSSNQLSGSIPSEWGSFSNLNVLNVESNQLTGTLPDSFSNLNGTLLQLFIGNNKLTGKIPSSWKDLVFLSIIDASGNCLHIDNETLYSWTNKNISAIPNGVGMAFYIFYYGDFTPTLFFPDCYEIGPINTSSALTSPYTYRRVSHGGMLDDSIVCDDSYFDASHFKSEIITTDYLNYEFALYSITRLNSLDAGRKIYPLNFYSGCAAAVSKLFLECYYDPDAFFTLGNAPPQSTSSSSSELISLSGLVPCDQQQPGRQFSVPAPPSWHNKSSTVPPLPQDRWFFSASDVKFLYGAIYRIRVDLGLADFTGRSKFYENALFTRPFVSKPCSANNTVAVPLTGSCVACPELAFCNSSTVMTVGEHPSWRFSTNTLPFVQCPASTRGCVSSKTFQNNNEAHNSSSTTTQSRNNNHQVVSPLGEECLEGYAGYLCARCDDNYFKVSGECLECPDVSEQITVAIIGVAIFLIVLAFLVYVSVDLSQFKQDEEGDSYLDRCYDYCCHDAIEKLSNFMKRFDKYKSIFERLVVTVRQLINHFSLLGALSNTNAAYHLAASVKAILRAQQTANTFAFGSYSAGLSCLLNHSTSTDIFELMWIGFFVIFGAETIIFSIWFRKLSVSVLVFFFLVHLAYSPLSEYSARLIALCDEYTFYPQRDYLMSVVSADGKRRITAEGNAIESTTIRLLSSDYSQDCDEDGFVEFRVLAALSIVFYCIGVPLLIVGLYKILTRMNRLSLRDEIFTFLTKHYKPEAWWYETVLMGRKLAVALIIGVLPNVSALQLQLFSFLCAIMLAISVKFQPLSSVTANNSDQLSIASALVCATLMSMSNAFQKEDGVQIGAAVGILLTQIVAVLSILLFGGADEESDNKLFSFFANCCSKNGQSSSKANEDYLLDREVDNSHEAFGVGDSHQQQHTSSVSNSRHQINASDDHQHVYTSSSVNIHQREEKAQETMKDDVECKTASGKDDVDDTVEKEEQLKKQQEESDHKLATLQQRIRELEHEKRIQEEQERELRERVESLVLENEKLVSEQAKTQKDGTKETNDE